MKSITSPFFLILFVSFLQSFAHGDADFIKMQQQIAELQAEVKALKGAQENLHGKYGIPLSQTLVIHTLVPIKILHENVGCLV